MKKLLTQTTIQPIINKLHKQNKRVVLAGGCFDILHIGHIVFLEDAKKEGDVLIVFLESDEKIKKLKGQTRPINSQDVRAKILASLEFVDYVITLPSGFKDEDYDQLVSIIKPAILATTKGDPFRFHKERSAELVDAKVVDVTVPIHNQSTTRLIKILHEL